MLKINKRFFMIAGIAFFLAGSMTSHETHAGFFSNIIDGVKDAAHTVMDTARTVVSKIANGTRSVASAIATDAKKAGTFLKAHAPTVASKAFDKMSAGLKGIASVAKPAADFLLAHRDVLENVLVKGLQNGKTIADIGLDVVGLIPGVNIPAEGVQILLDAVLPGLTVAAQTAFEADQKLLMNK